MPATATGGISREEVAALAAVIALLDEEARRARAVPVRAGESELGDAWVVAARLRGRGMPLERGPWRLAGRVAGRRSP